MTGSSLRSLCAALALLLGMLPATLARAQTFAAIQFSPGPVPSDNLRELSTLIRQAARDGATAVVLPEHAISGPFPTDGSEISQLWEMNSAQSDRMLAGLAKELSIWIFASVPERGPGYQGMVINSVVYDHEGELARRQAKLSPHMERGDGPAIPGDYRQLASLDFPGARIGVAAGDDIQRVVPRLVACGAETILVSASWEAADAVNWREMAIDLAAKYKVNLVISNLASADLPSELRSMVISRSGEIVSAAKSSGNLALLGTVPGGVSRPNAPLGLPSIPIPTQALTSSSAVEFGRALFLDAKLSRDGRTSCSSCHVPGLAFADGRKVAQGVYSRQGQRNTPSLINSAYKIFFAWDGSAETMESQAQHALRGWAEMAITPEQVVEYVNHAPQYARFRKSGEISFDGIVANLTAYLRTLVVADSPFDRFYFAGDDTAISPRAQRGFDIFVNKAKCAACHEIGRHDALFSDNSFHNTGIGFQKRFEYLGYSGDGVEGNAATKNRFRGEYLTPSLRNVALTAPYMHDGSLATLEDVVRFYNQGGNPNNFLDKRIKPLGLSPAECNDLVAFLKTLTGRAPAPQALPLKARR